MMPLLVWKKATLISLRCRLRYVQYPHSSAEAANWSRKRMVIAALRIRDHPLCNALTPTSNSFGERYRIRYHRNRNKTSFLGELVLARATEVPVPCCMRGTRNLVQRLEDRPGFPCKIRRRFRVHMMQGIQIYTARSLRKMLTIHRRPRMVDRALVNVEERTNTDNVQTYYFCHV
jgi:hypothetical protein